MKHLSPFILLLLVILGCTRAGKVTEPNKPNVFTDDKQTEIQKQILKKLGKFPRNWDTVDFTKWEMNAITIYLNYKKMPANLIEVEVGTKEIAQTTLDVLVANGYEPRKEWLALFVHAQMHESGATGTAMTRRLGKTAYNFNTDSLDFTPVK